MAGPFTVLVVDPNEQIRTLLTAFLGKYGFAVDSAADIDSAMSKLASANFDLLVLDPACSPDGDGVRHLAGAVPDIVPRTVVIAAAPHGHVREGVHAVLEKPFDIQTLLRMALDTCRSRYLHLA